MGSDWQEVSLDRVVDLKTGFPFKSKDYTDSTDDPRLLRGDNIGQGVLRWEDAKHWPQECTSEVEDYWLEAGDVVLAMDRPWIEAGLKYAAVRGADLPSLLVQRVARLRGTTLLDTGFLHYVIGSRAFTEYVLAVQTGTAVPHISGGQIKDFRFLLPPLSEQRAIASVLGALDDKIELNRQTNRTLEEMAAALFKSWFVDFDPVHDKAEGRRPFGMDDETAALFPDRFVETEEGLLPGGWMLCAMDDAFDLTMGQSPPGSTYNEEGEGLIFFQGRRDFGVRYPTPRVYCMAPTRYARSGDTLVSVRAPVGDANLALVDCCIGRGLAAVRHRSGVRGYTYQVVKALRPVFDTFEGEGTVFGSINGKTLKALPILEPPAEVVARFENTVSKWEDLVETNENESTTLADLRDTLLPKLLSGEIRLKQAEKAVEGAV